MPSVPDARGKANIKVQISISMACARNLVELPVNHPAIEASVTHLEALCRQVRAEQAATP